MSIKLEGVTYTYSPGTAYEMHALKEINLEIPQGQFVGIIGHTGSGKSTLIQHLNGLVRPTAGRGFCLRGRISGQRIIRCVNFGFRSDLYFSIRSTSCLSLRCSRTSALDRPIRGWKKKSV